MDPGLLNESREKTGGLIVKLAGYTGGKQPGTYRQQDRKRSLNLTGNNNRARPMETGVRMDGFLEQKISI